MYTKDKNQRITLRLTEEQFNFVKNNSEMLGVSPSDFLRMMVNVTMATEKASASLLENHKPEMVEDLTDRVKVLTEEYKKGEAERRENETTDIHDKL